MKRIFADLRRFLGNRDSPSIRSASFHELLRETEPEEEIHYVEPPFDFNAEDVSAYLVEVSGYRLIRSLERRLGWPSLAGKRLLDFGCGVRFVRTIVNLGLEIGHYAGIDTNAAPIAWLQENVADPRFSFMHLDMQNEMYNVIGRSDNDANSVAQRGLTGFDAACMFSVITHQKPADAELIFAMLSRCVVSGGYLYFTAFADEGVDTYTEHDPAKTCHMSTYHPASLISMVARAGWSVADVYRPSGFQQTAFVCRK